MIQPNTTYIKKLAAGDLAFERELMTILKKEFFIEKKQYYKLIENRNFKELAQLVHKIRHKFVILGLTKQTDLASRYEQELKNNRAESNDKFEKILEIINDYLTSAPS